MHNPPAERTQEVLKSGVGVGRAMRVVVEVTPRFQLEVPLNGDEAPARTKLALGLGQDLCALFEREVPGPARVVRKSNVVIFRWSSWIVAFITKSRSMPADTHKFHPETVH